MDDFLRRHETCVLALYISESFNVPELCLVIASYAHIQDMLRHLEQFFESGNCIECSAANFHVVIRKLDDPWYANCRILFDMHNSTPEQFDLIHHRVAIDPVELGDLFFNSLAERWETAKVMRFFEGIQCDEF